MLRIGFRSRYAILPVSFVPRILASSSSTSLELDLTFTVPPCFNVLRAESAPLYTQQRLAHTSVVSMHNATGLLRFHAFPLN